jgi:hypothetical protein
VSGNRVTQGMNMDIFANAAFFGDQLNGFLHAAFVHYHRFTLANVWRFVHPEKSRLDEDGFSSKREVPVM